MSEIKLCPGVIPPGSVFTNKTDELVIFFTDEHSHSDILRYVIGDIGSDALFIVKDILQKETPMERVNNAVVFAAQAHKNQQRKYTGEPYIVHPIEVMMLVREYGGDEDMQCAAVLHDVIEDCGVTYDEISSMFGTDVASYVRYLSDMEEGNRSERKFASKVRLASAPSEVHTIKLADLYSNTRDIAEADAKFASMYLREKVDLMQVLTRGNRALFMKVWHIIPEEYRFHISLKDLF